MRTQILNTPSHAQGRPVFSFGQGRVKLFRQLSSKQSPGTLGGFLRLRSTLPRTRKATPPATSLLPLSNCELPSCHVCL